MPLSVASPPVLVPVLAPVLVPWIIHAKDASPAAIDEAFARAAAQTRPGLFGPIGRPVVFIPIASEAPGSRARAVPPRPARSAPQTGSPLDRIRSHRHAIAGYACKFNHLAGNWCEIVAPGAFRRALTANAFYLLLNHSEGVPSLASMAARTLHVEEDAAGLWFEASLPESAKGAWLFRLIEAAGVTGISTGSSGYRAEQINGVCVFREMNAWELSVLTPPKQPRFGGSWVANNREARRRRRLEL